MARLEMQGDALDPSATDTKYSNVEKIKLRKSY